MNRRTSLRALAALAAAAVCGTAAAQQAWPSKTIRIVVPFPAGGGYDFVARGIAQKLAESLGQPVVVENRAGANGNIGSDSVAKAAPDGYTLLLGGIGPQALSVALYPKLPYDPLKDFAPITLAAGQPNLLVIRPTLPAKTLAEFIAFAKANPGKITFGSRRQRQRPALRPRAAQARRRHRRACTCPTRARRRCTPRCSAARSTRRSTSSSCPCRRCARANCARSASRARSARRSRPRSRPWPNSAIPIDFDTWYALYAPAGTPPEIIARLNRETNQALKAPDFRERAAALGVDLIGSTPAELEAHMRAEIARWQRIARIAKIKVD